MNPLPADPMPCTCGWNARRRFVGFSALLALGAAAPVGSALASINECKRSKAANLIPAEQIEGAAQQQYRQMLQQASSKRALASADHPQLQRLQYIAKRIVPFTAECNERARQWQWEVNLLGSNDLNAFCMPGGKIAFFYGILSRLQLSDDEVATIMGHEMAHALLEHSREQAAKSGGTQLLLRGGAALLGLGDLGDLAAQGIGELASRKFGRTDELEADALGLLLSARAGYDPRAGISLWQKMKSASGGKNPPGWLSTHPSGKDRIKEIEQRLPRVLPMFEAAGKPGQRFGPPAVPAKS